MNSISRKQTGFTIVELLIVIVVIGILAAITIVAFNGVQKRAGTIAYTSAVDSLEKQITMGATTGELSTTRSITADSGNEGVTSAWARVVVVLALALTGGAPTGIGYCIGTTADYPAIDGFEAGECLRQEAGGESESLFIDQEYSAELLAAGVVLPKNLPVVRDTSTMVSYQNITTISRGVTAIPLGAYGVILYWSPPDASNCGRGENMSKLVTDAMQEEIDAQGGLEAYINTYIRDDPEALAEAEAAYGAEWEQGVRSFFEGLYGTNNTGACLLEVKFS